MTIAIEDVRAALLADAAAAALFLTRIYPEQANENEAYPYAVLNTVRTQPLNHLGGSSGLDLCEIQVQTFANSFTVATDGARVCRHALEAAGFLCLSESDAPYDGDVSPGVYTAGHIFQAWSS